MGVSLVCMVNVWVYLRRIKQMSKNHKLRPKTCLFQFVKWKWFIIHCKYSIAHLFGWDVLCFIRGGLIVPADSRWRRKSPPPSILSIILFCFILGLIILGLMVYWLMIMITCICLAIYIVYVSLFLANSEAWRYILIN